MVATRVYNLDGYWVCDLMCPITSAAYTRAPICYGLGSGVNAPSDPWPGNGVAWEDLPRVAVMYLSSLTQSTRSPVVVGVLKTNSSRVQKTVQAGTDGTTRTAEPDTKDAHLSTADAKVIVRDAGNIDNIASGEYVVRAGSIFLKTDELPLKAPAIAEELVAALSPLYSTVNKILEFIEGFPNKLELALAAQATPQGAGGVVVPLEVTMKFNVKGTLIGPNGVTPISVDVDIPYTPYEGPIRVDEPNPQDFDAPKVLVTPRD